MVSNHCKEMCKQEDNILQSENDEASHRWINLKQMEQSKNQTKIKKHRKNKKNNILRLFGENPNVKKTTLRKPKKNLEKNIFQRPWGWGGGLAKSLKKHFRF